MRPYRYFLVYKPFGMLSQFTPEQEGQSTLADLHDFPKEIYPVGRLDKDSEGLLLLTDDNRLKTRLLNPKNHHPRTYWVQVEGRPDPGALKQLEEGVTIRVNKKDYRTRPARARLLNPGEAERLPDRDPPIRYRKSVPDTWLELILTEGKNRQVRRMCARVGYPVLRLVRVGIGNLRWPLHGSAAVEELSGETVQKGIFRE